MATLVPRALSRVYDHIGPYLNSDRRGGIANSGSPGYHTSREDLLKQGRSSDYSIQAPADQRGNAKNAAGIDITLSDAEMKTVTNRLRKACTPVDGEYDDRIECIREFIGTTDGRNVQGYNRYASGSGSRSSTGWVSSGFSDSSHLWHVHVSVFRDRVEDDNDMLGLAEVIAGLPAGALGWSASGKPVAPVDPPPPVPKLPTYTVQRGDSLSAIASRIGVSWQTIAALNPGVDPNKIRAGQILIVPKEVPPKPTPPKPVTKPERITLALRDWDDSPAGRTLIQGVLWDPVNDCYFVHQADDVTGRTEQTVVIRRHHADGTYVGGHSDILEAGHGSSVGADPFKGGARLWLGHAKLGSSGFMTYNIGGADVPFTAVSKIPKGDISVDQAADLLCVRVGNNYRGYKLSDARQNKATKVFDFKVPTWLVRFQGHTVAKDRVYIHRDAKTKGASEMRSYDFSGKLLRKWDTSPWGDEAEGAMVKRGWVYSVSRVGNDTPGRTILCTPIEEY
jgi:LysM repeat protein